MQRASACIILTLAAAMHGCSPSESVSARIAAEAKDAESFELAKLTEFAWDKAFVFGPYATSERVCGALPASWTQCAGVLAGGIDEGNYFLAFVQRGVVVHHELHQRSNGEFCSESCILQLTPHDARFKVVSSNLLGSGAKRFSQVAPTQSLEPTRVGKPPIAAQLQR